MDNLLQTSDPLKSFYTSLGLDNIQRLQGTSFASNYWANAGIDVDVPFSNKRKTGQVWLAESPEMLKEEQDRLDFLAEYYQKSVTGVAGEALRQAGTSIVGTVLDTINLAVGSEGLADTVRTMRFDAHRRMAAYEDDVIRRNVIGAASSIAQLFAWRGAGLVAGAAVGTVLPPVGAAIAASSLVPVSIGFGLSEWSDTYHTGRLMGLDEDTASNRAITAGLITGVSTYGISKYFDAGLASMLGKKNAGKAAELGFAKAIEVSKKINIGEALSSGVKNYSVEVGQEFIGLAGHLINDKYWLDRDIDPSEIGIAATDIMLSMFITIPTVQAIAGGTQRLMMRPRTPEVIRVANDAFHILNEQHDKTISSRNFNELVDYMDANDVDLAAVSEVINQFVGLGDAQAFERSVATALRERQIKQATAQAQADKSRYTENAGSEAYKAAVEDGMSEQFVVPVALPEGIPESQIEQARTPYVRNYSNTEKIRRFASVASQAVDAELDMALSETARNIAVSYTHLTLPTKRIV